MKSLFKPFTPISKLVHKLGSGVLHRTAFAGAPMRLTRNYGVVFFTPEAPVAPVSLAPLGVSQTWEFPPTAGFPTFPAVGPGLLKLFRASLWLTILGSSLTSVCLAAEQGDSQNSQPKVPNLDWGSALTLGVGVVFIIGIGLSLGVGYARFHPRESTPKAAEPAPAAVSEAPRGSGAPQEPQVAPVRAIIREGHRQWGHVSAPPTETVTDAEAFVYVNFPRWLGRRLAPVPGRGWSYPVVQFVGSCPTFQKILLLVAVVGTGLLLWELFQLRAEVRARRGKPADPMALPWDWEDRSPSRPPPKFSPLLQTGAPPPVAVLPEMDWVTLVQPAKLGLTRSDFRGLTRELLDPTGQLSEAQLAKRVQLLVQAFRSWPRLRDGHPVREDLLGPWGPRRPEVLQLLLRVGMAAASPPSPFLHGFRGDARALPTPLALLPLLGRHLDGSINRELLRLYRYQVTEGPAPPGDWVNEQLRGSGYWYVQRALSAQGNSALFRSVPLTLLPSPFLSTLFREHLLESVRGVNPAYRALLNDNQQPAFGTSLAAMVYWHCLAEQAGAQTFRTLEWAAFGVNPATLHHWFLQRQALAGPAALAQWKELLLDPIRTLEPQPPTLGRGFTFFDRPPSSEELFIWKKVSPNPGTRCEGAPQCKPPRGRVPPGEPGGTPGVPPSPTMTRAVLPKDPFLPGRLRPPQTLLPTPPTP